MAWVGSCTLPFLAVGLFCTIVTDNHFLMLMCCTGTFCAKACCALKQHYCRSKYSSELLRWVRGHATPVKVRVGMLKSVRGNAMPVKLTVGRHAIRATASLFRVRGGSVGIKVWKAFHVHSLGLCMAARCNAMSSSLQKTLWTQNTHV